MQEDLKRLKHELATRAIRTMGPRSPYWNCTLCGASQTTPIEFKHKPDCLLADTPNPAALVPESQHKHFYSIEVQHAERTKALENIAGFGSVNLASEWEHGLRDIIRSMTDCAKRALGEPT